MNNEYKIDTSLLYGAAYYPEQWNEGDWKKDFEQMQSAGMNVVRMAEFAWVAIEPSEGEYSLDWLDRAIEIAASCGIQTILGTPTASPPLWLTKKYPEVLGEEFSGRKRTHGGRCHYNWTNEKYLEFCRKIAHIIAHRYGRNPSVIGWQIDNELSIASHDEGTELLFQNWLEARYGTIENLNRLWGMRYWGTDLESFSDIGIHFELTTPCYHLAWRRFLTDQWCRYANNQLSVMRPHCNSNQFFTTNFHGIYGYGDAQIIAADMDIAGFDYYTGSGAYDCYETAMVMDITRGVKRRNFALLEIQPWHQNWGAVNDDYEPGAARTFIWQAIAHGANAILYWQYRVASGGMEQYHGALANAAGYPRPCFGEAREIGLEMNRLSRLVAGTANKAECAIIYRDSDRWTVDINKHTRAFSWLKHATRFHESLQRMGCTVDSINGSGDLTQYRLILAPHLHIYTNNSARKLLEWVNQGGHLVLGARSGVKDDENALLTNSCPPGQLFIEALGAQVADHYALGSPVAISIGGEASVWAERLEVINPQAEVLWRFGEGNGWLKNHPALISTQYGRGRISYLAFFPDEHCALELGRWFRKIGSLPEGAVELPAGIERITRTGDTVTLAFWINHTSSECTLKIETSGDLVGGNSSFTDNKLHLPSFGVAVIQS